MERYYFCNTHMAFSHDCQVVTIRKGDNIAKVAEQWAKTNGYKTVYVYTMNHDLLWTYNF